MIKFRYHPRLRIHILAWSIFVIYEVIVGYSFSNGFGPWYDYLIMYSINLLLFYVHQESVYQIVKRRIYVPQKILFAVLAEVAAYLVIKRLCFMGLAAVGVHQEVFDEPIKVFLRGSIWRAIYFLGLGTAFAFVRLTMESRKRINTLDSAMLERQLQVETLEKSLLSFENAYLKAQINPHFLFNTINFLYNKVSVTDEEAGDLLIEFSDILRYAMTEPGNDGKVSLSSEVRHVENYLKLNNKRFAGTGGLHLVLEGSIGAERIIPLLLSTIIENVYKYGDIFNKVHPPAIILKVADAQLHLDVRNRKVLRKHYHSTGIGMTNLVKRLDLSYADQYRLAVEQDEEAYHLALTINL